MDNSESKIVRCDIDPVKPTSARPGSEAKVRVLMARADMKLPLFHPLDDRAGFDRPPGEAFFLALAREEKDREKQEVVDEFRAHQRPAKKRRT